MTAEAKEACLEGERSLMRERRAADQWQAREATLESKHSRVRECRVVEQAQARATLFVLLLLLGTYDTSSRSPPVHSVHH